MVNISCIEYTTAVICASLPHLKALVSRILPSLLDSAIRSLREKRQSIQLPNRKSWRNSTQPAPTLQAFGPGEGISTYGHSAFVSAGDKKTRFQLLGSQSEEYVLEPVSPGEIHVSQETEVGVQERDASSRQADRHHKGSNWPA